jgi:hypothetical protein
MRTPSTADIVTKVPYGGRSVDVVVERPVGGMPLVYHHGTPGAVPFPPLMAARPAPGLHRGRYDRFRACLFRPARIIDATAPPASGGEVVEQN